MSDHAAFSPSGSEKRYLCPASYALEYGLPDTENEYSREGTTAHSLAELMLRVHLTRRESPEVRFHAAEELNDFRNSLPEKWKGMPEQVAKYVDKLLVYADGHELFIEQKLNYAQFVGANEDEAWGTGDGIVLTPDEIQIHDFKYGMGVKVFAERNRQLMCYALGALDSFAMVGDFKRVRLVIHQPRLDHLDEWDCTIEELMEFADEEWASIRQCREALSERQKGELEEKWFNPGEKQCRWCKAAATCPALQQLAESEFLNEMDGPQPVPTDAQILGRKLDLAPLLEHYVKAVRAEAEKQAFAGNPPIGKDGAYKLVRGKKGNRAWSDESQAEALLKSFKLKRDDMYVSKLITPTAAESLLKKEQPRRWAKAQALISQSDGGISIAPATDKREAYIPTPSDDEFSDIDAEESLT